MSANAQEQDQLQANINHWIIILIAPILIMILVGSLIYFLIEVFYSGVYDGRLRYIFGLFTIAVVLVSRISIDEGRERAMLFGLPLGFASWFVSSRFIEVDGVLSLFSPMVNAILIGVAWWCAAKLTWDCTVVELSKDVTNQGLIRSAADRFRNFRDAVNEIGRGESDEAPSAEQANRQPQQTPRQAANEPNNAYGLDRYGNQVREPDNDVQLYGTSSTEQTDLEKWWSRLPFGKRKKQNAPGIWVVYFSMAAIPIFGIGQAFIPVTSTGSRRFAFFLFVMYLMAALGLLLTTSLFSLQRYLRKRDLSLPNPIAVSWISVGGIGIVAILIAVWLLPRPAPEYSWLPNPIRFISSDELNPNRYGMGRDGQIEANGGGGQQNDETPQATHTGQSSQGGGNQSSSDQGQGGSGQQGSGGERGNSQGQRGQSNSSDDRQSDHDHQQSSGGSNQSDDSSSGQQNSNDQGTSSSDSNSQSDSNQNQNDRSQDDQSQSPGSRSNDSSDSQSSQGNSGGQSDSDNQDNNQSSDNQSTQNNDSNQSSGGSNGNSGSQSDSSSGSPDQQVDDNNQSDRESSQNQSSNNNSSSNQSSGSRSQSGQRESQSPSNETERSSNEEEEPNQSSSGGGGNQNNQRQNSSSQGAGNQSSSSNPLENFSLDWVGGLVKAIFIVLLIAVIIFAIIWYREKLVEMLRNFIQALQDLIAGLLGLKKPKRVNRNVSLAEATPEQPPQPFSSYRDPFESGNAQDWSPKQLVAYTFQAFEAWARDRECPREQDQTPREFAISIGQVDKDVATQAKQMAKIYAQVAYAPNLNADVKMDSLRAFWQILRQRYINPPRAESTGT